MRSHYCGHVTEELDGQEVTLCGWVNRRRDHGGVIFVDLRDREGLVQIVFDPDRAEMFAEAETIRNEFVLKVQGRVRMRDEAAINPKLATGKIEVLALEMDIFCSLEVESTSSMPDTSLGKWLRMISRGAPPSSSLRPYNW